MTFVSFLCVLFMCSGSSSSSSSWQTDFLLPPSSSPSRSCDRLKGTVTPQSARDLNISVRGEGAHTHTQPGAASSHHHHHNHHHHLLLSNIHQTQFSPWLLPSLLTRITRSCSILPVSVIRPDIDVLSVL